MFIGILLIMFRLKEYLVNSSNYLELWKANMASHTLSFYILWFLHTRFEERGGGNRYEKKLWRRRYEYTFMICVACMNVHTDQSTENIIFYLSSDWWMILWERKKAQIKLENHKIWFVWYDNIMEKGNTNFFGLVCNNNICFMECALINLSIQSKLMLK